MIYRSALLAVVGIKDSDQLSEMLEMARLSGDTALANSPA